MMSPGPRILERGIEMCRRAFETNSFETLGFLLTNDMRAIVEFDRCSLIVHLGGVSRLESVSGQPILDKKAKLYNDLVDLAKQLRGHNRAMALPRQYAFQQDEDPNVPGDILQAIRSYFDSSGSEFVAILPLGSGDEIAGHLLLEFFDRSPTDRAGLDALAVLAPFFGAALIQKWLLKKKSRLGSFLRTGEKKRANALSRTAKFLIGLTLAVTAAALLLFVAPITATVGGETEIVPRNKYVAFSRMEGVIDEVFVQEGQHVEKGQPLARLDPRDLDYRIEKARTDYEIATAKFEVLRKSSDKNEAKLAESKLVDIERKGYWLDYKYYEWLKRFLVIRAPVSGIVVTKDVQTLKGKKLQAGEQLCELVSPKELWAQIYVPDDRVGDVHAGEPVRLYLNKDPLKAYHLKVAEVSPQAAPHERLGNVFQVRAPFPEGRTFAKVGMKGIGKIDTGDTTVWTIIVRRVLRIWNGIALYF